MSASMQWQGLQKPCAGLVIALVRPGGGCVRSFSIELQKKHWMTKMQPVRRLINLYAVLWLLRNVQHFLRRKEG